MSRALVLAVVGVVAVSACGPTPPFPSSSGPTPQFSVPASEAAPSPTIIPPQPTHTATPAIDPEQLLGRLAFSDSDDIWSSLANGTARTRLTTAAGLDFDPTWSPDGSHIAFRSHRTGDEEVWVMGSDGADQHNLSKSAGGDWSPSWSPDGGTIAFSSDRSGQQALWLMSPDGTDLRQVTTIEGEYPSWDPTGSQLAFASGSAGLYDIFTVDLATGETRNLTQSPAYDFAPSWSPDGRYVAYDTQRDFQPREPGIGPEFEIHIIDLRTGEDRRVTNNHAEDRFPCWSPDGKLLLWSREGNLIVGRPDGTAELALGAGTFPSWAAQ